LVPHAKAKVLMHHHPHTYIHHISLLFYHKTRLESLPILDSLYEKYVKYGLVSCSSSTEIFVQSWCTIPALVFVLILK
jgi:hypothetical protein